MALEQPAGQVGRCERFELGIQICEESVAQEQHRADPGRHETDGEERDGDPGDLGAQARATPPPGDRIGLGRQSGPLSVGRQAVLPALSM
jgi:hypothetical protein